MVSGNGSEQYSPFLQPGEQEHCGDILDLCLHASALSLHMHILHVSVAAGKYVSVHEDRKYLGKWQDIV